MKIIILLFDLFGSDHDFLIDLFVDFGFEFVNLFPLFNIIRN